MKNEKKIILTIAQLTIEQPSVTLRDIAKKADLPTSTVFSYFSRYWGFSNGDIIQWQNDTARTIQLADGICRIYDQFGRVVDVGRIDRI